MNLETASLEELKNYLSDNSQFLTSEEIELLKIQGVNL